MGLRQSVNRKFDDENIDIQAIRHQLEQQQHNNITVKLVKVWNMLPNEVKHAIQTGYIGPLHAETTWRVVLATIWAAVALFILWKAWRCIRGGPYQSN